MSTILKTKFKWAFMTKSVFVYSDKARFFRESILFTDKEFEVTPHQAIELSKPKDVAINLCMLGPTDRLFVTDILIKQNVKPELIIT